MQAEFAAKILPRSMRKLVEWVKYGEDLSGFWFQFLVGDLYSAACK
jgi:hypothetical protein